MDISITEVMRLEGILKELLDFAKPLQLKYDSVQINEILKSSVELLDMKSREDEISIITNLDSKIPDFSADGEKLQQAIINLILNAMEASDKNGKIWVQTLFRQENNQSLASIIIKDEGKGLFNELLPEIFKPFFTTKTRGPGLGLTNVNRIVEDHRGWLKVQNHQPCGASFQITLPVEEIYGQNTHNR